MSPRITILHHLALSLALSAGLSVPLQPAAAKGLQSPLPHAAYPPPLIQRQCPGGYIYDPWSKHCIRAR